MRTNRIIIALSSAIGISIVVLFTFFGNWTGNILRVANQNLNIFDLYQNVANPYIRFVSIPEGLRKEEVADIYSKVLAWNDQDVQEFLQDGDAVNLEGRYYPSTYILPVDASGNEVKEVMLDKFDQKVVDGLKGQKTVLDKNKINIETALKIASLIQREAGGKSDMNLISGIIWNRIWNGMSLDIDATLQYAKGNDQNGWWPQVKSQDKNIDSPYNTYKNKGLPPTPIANPGLAAIEAAYNPAVTDCLFYFHDNNHKIHCSKTYAGQVSGVQQYLIDPQSQAAMATGSASTN